MQNSCKTYSTPGSSNLENQKLQSGLGLPKHIMLEWLIVILTHFNNTLQINQFVFAPFPISSNINAYIQVHLQTLRPLDITMKQYIGNAECIIIQWGTHTVNLHKFDPSRLIPD